MVITRILPKSVISRQKTLDKAELKQSTLTPATQVLSPQTVTRLATAHSVFGAGIVQLESSKAAFSANTALKEPRMAQCRLFTSHFLQVFNLGVARGKYPAAHRSFFGMEVESAALPPLETEADILFYANKVITGDPLRMAVPGAMPMDNPDAPEVMAVHVPTLAIYTQQMVLKAALESSQEALQGMNPDVDKVIKRVLDEVDTFHSEESPESRRAKCREWGAVYVTEGPAAILTGLVKDATGSPRQGAEMEVVETGAKAITNAEGRYSLPTTVIGTATVQASWPGETPVTHEVEIPEHEHEVTIEVGDMVI